MNLLDKDILIAAIHGLLPGALWLIGFIYVIRHFKDEIKSRLRLLGNFKVAGASFEFHSQKETVRSYILLSETFIGLLSSNWTYVERISEMVSPSQAEQLGYFAFEYTGNVPPEEWNQALLVNIAFLLLRTNRSEQSVELCTQLLKARPSALEFLNIKGLALLTSRVPSNVQKAEEIYEDLVRRYPEAQYAHIRFNLALTKSMLQKHSDAAAEMKDVIDLGYGKMNPALLDDVLFHFTRENEPKIFEELKSYLGSS